MQNDSAHKLLESLWEKVRLHSEQEISDLISHPSRVLFDATMSGNVGFLAVLLHHKPDLLWQLNENNQTIFHVAVLYRQVHVFNLIYNVGTFKDYLVGYVDNEGNSMLHLAGQLPQPERLGALRANIQMQREILWFKVFLITRSVFIHFQHSLYIIFNSQWHVEVGLSYS